MKNFWVVSGSQQGLNKVLPILKKCLLTKLLITANEVNLMLKHRDDTRSSKLTYHFFHEFEQGI